VWSRYEISVQFVLVINKNKWNLSHTKVNKGTLLEREQAKIIDVKKKEIQNSLGKNPAQTWVNL